MRLSLFALGLCLSAAPAYAQVGTYRPAPVASVSPATAPDQCVSHCSGDAGCRGWNFVTVAPGQAVCEMLAGDAEPVPNLRATSGTAPGLAPSHHRILRGTPGRTVRIGSPEPRIVTRPAAKPTSQPARAMPPIERRPVPQAPRFRHALETAPRPAWSQPRAAAPVAPAPTRPVPVQPPTQRPVAAPRPVAPQPAPAAPARSPFAAKPQTAPQPQTQMRPPVPQAPRTLGNVEESLFGSLYDDVAIPAPPEVSENIADADAPVATAVAVPVRPVSSESLKGLAGG